VSSEPSPIYVGRVIIIFTIENWQNSLKDPYNICVLALCMKTCMTSQGHALFDDKSRSDLYTKYVKFYSLSGNRVAVVGNK